VKKNLARFLNPGIVFVLTLGSGFWLSRLGKPLNGALFNLHKLIALGAVVYTAVTFHQLLKISSAPPLLFLILFIAGLSVIALFATGALMSMDKAGYGTFLILHRIAPLILIATVSLAIYLFLAAGTLFADG
jgi:hypothetical protein